MLDLDDTTPIFPRQRQKLLGSPSLARSLSAKLSGETWGFYGLSRLKLHNSVEAIADLGTNATEVYLW